MKSRGRIGVLMVSVPVLAFAVVGGFMGKAMARQESYQALRIFEDVVTLIMNNYVEEVQVDKVMQGAMHGLADGLDPDSAYLNVEQVKLFEKNDSPGTGTHRRGVDAAVLPARDRGARRIARGQGRAAAGRLHPRDRRPVHARHVGVRGHAAARRQARHEGDARRASRQRRGAASGGARSRRTPGRAGAIAAGAARRRLLRIAEFGKATPDQITSEVATLTKGGATRLVIDLRGTAFGDVESGPRRGASVRSVRHARLSGRNAARRRKPVATAAGDGSITLPVALLTDNGTSGPAELFAAALTGNKRASLVGERTLGRAARQRLVRLPDGSGLLLTHLLYLTPGEAVINEKGLTPDVAVEQPDVEFGRPLPTTDATLDKAIEQLKSQVGRALRAVRRRSRSLAERAHSLALVARRSRLARQAYFSLPLRASKASAPPRRA